MNARMRELVSLGASVSAHCFPCFDYHLEKARKLGIGEDEIQASVHAGLMVMDGAGQKMLERIQEMFPGISIKKTHILSDRRRVILNRLTHMVRY